MLRERIKTSLIVPKIIFLLTIFLGVMCVILAIMFLTVDAQTIIITASEFTESFSESVGVSDEIKAEVIRGDP